MSFPVNSGQRTSLCFHVFCFCYGTGFLDADLQTRGALSVSGLLVDAFVDVAPLQCFLLMPLYRDEDASARHHRPNWTETFLVYYTWYGASGGPSGGSSL